MCGEGKDSVQRDPAVQAAIAAAEGNSTALDAWWCATPGPRLARVMIEAESKEQMDRLAEGLWGRFGRSWGLDDRPVLSVIAVYIN